MAYVDVYCNHNGGTDVSCWSPDGAYIYFTAKFGDNVEIVRTTIEGEEKRLTYSVRTGPIDRTPRRVSEDDNWPSVGAWNYHLSPSPDGKWIAFFSNRTGVRQMYTMRSDGTCIRQVTRVKPGWGASNLYWQPVASGAQKR